MRCKFTVNFMNRKITDLYEKKNADAKEKMVPERLRSEALVFDESDRELASLLPQL